MEQEEGKSNEQPPTKAGLPKGKMSKEVFLVFAALGAFWVFIAWILFW